MARISVPGVPQKTPVLDREATGPFKGVSDLISEESKAMRRLTTGLVVLAVTLLFGFGGTVGWTAEEVTAVANPSLTQTAYFNLPRFAKKHGINLK